VNAGFVVADASIVISALMNLEGPTFAALKQFPAGRLAAPRFVIVELFKHKERIVQRARQTEDDVLDALGVLAAKINFLDESACKIGDWAETWRLCRDVDPRDVACVALTLNLNGSPWT